jgi:uncharacterized protein YndB with AHSA1/START domain
MVPFRPESLSGGIEIRQRVAAPIDRIWQACSSPRGFMNWQADQAYGEAKKGSTLTLAWLAFGARLELDVVDVVPYERIVLHHGDSIVELSFDQQLVTLRHTGPEASSDAEGLDSSWRVSLAQLAHSVERHPGRRRRVRWFLNRMHCTPEAAYLCFSEAALLSRWLGSGSGLGPTGASVSLILPSGARLSGSVLMSVPGRDVAIRCQSFDDSVLGMRTLPLAGGGRLVALVWSEWGDSRSDDGVLFADFAAGLQRLSLLLGDTPQA